MLYSLVLLLASYNLVTAQSNTVFPGPSPTNVTGFNTSQHLTTTITSLIPQASNHTSTLVLTLTLVTPSNLTVASNSTLNSTAANVTVPWNETDQNLPFSVDIDPAFGVLGAILIITGLPVAVLGGKNRWCVGTIDLS
jgi:hypothetical protein